MREKTGNMGDVIGGRGSPSDEDEMRRGEMKRPDNDVRRWWNERNYAGERRGEENARWRGDSSIRIPRHAPFYHIDRHSNDSLSSNDVGMHYSPGRKRDVGERGIMREEIGRRGRTREGRKGRQVVPHGVPRHPTMRGCGPPRVERERECEARRGASGTKRKEARWGSRGGGGEGIYVTRTRTSRRGKEVEKRRRGGRRAAGGGRLRETNSIGDRDRMMIRGWRGEEGDRDAHDDWQVYVCRVRRREPVGKKGRERGTTKISRATKSTGGGERWRLATTELAPKRAEAAVPRGVAAKWILVQRWSPARPHLAKLPPAGWEC